MKITDAMVEAARAEFHRPPCGNQRTPCCEDKSHVHWFVNEYDRMKRAVHAALAAAASAAPVKDGA